MPLHRLRRHAHPSPDPFSLTGEGLLEARLDGRLRSVSGAFADSAGVRPDELTGRRVVDLVEPADAPALLSALNPLGAGSELRCFRARLRGGEPRAWRAVVDVAGDRIFIVVGSPVPEAERRASRAFDVTFASAPIGMAVVSAEGVIRRANPALCELRGDDPTGQRWEELVAEEDVAPAREQLARLVAGELTAVAIDVRTATAGGAHRPVGFTVSLAGDEFIVQVLDASEHEELRARVRFEAEHDPLTGVLNRHAFAQVLGHHVAYARRYRRTGALVLFDLCGLRDINELYGASVGDAALSALARVLRERLRETDVVARLGGGEFGVMLPEADRVGAERIAADLQHAAAGRTVDLPGATPVRLAVRAGIALFDETTCSPETLFGDADIALSEAKEAGAARALVLDADVRSRRAARQSRRTWAEKLRAGLESDAFLLDAQPIVDLRTGRPVQYELLLRLRDDDGALVRPSAFLEVAERAGLMRAIDEWVVRRAVALARARIEMGRPVTLAINVSGESVGDGAFLPVVVDELIDSPDVGAHLVFEITERTAVGDLEQAKRLIARLSEFGCRFALDDFGTANGSFTHLKHLPVDYVKLDGEFTRSLPTDSADREIVAAVVQAARGLGKQVVAECVEDPAILEAVRGFGVDLVQGLHVGRPGRAIELLDLEGIGAAAPTSATA